MRAALVLAGAAGSILFVSAQEAGSSMTTILVDTATFTLPAIELSESSAEASVPAVTTTATSTRHGFSMPKITVSPTATVTLGSGHGGGGGGGGGGESSSSNNNADQTIVQSTGYGNHPPQGPSVLVVNLSLVQPLAGTAISRGGEVVDLVSTVTVVVVIAIMSILAALCLGREGRKKT
jgi:hypothetical protein